MSGEVPVSTMTEQTLADVREAFIIATAGNWRSYPAYVDRILDEALDLAR